MATKTKAVKTATETVVMPDSLKDYQEINKTYTKGGHRAVLWNKVTGVAVIVNSKDGVMTVKETFTPSSK